MKTYLVRVALFLLILPFIFAFNVAKPEVYSVETNGIEVKEVRAQEISTKKLDKEAQVLASYLSKYNSPMQYHAQDFIDASKKYGLDWKMLPSIAGVESTFGKKIPGGYNAYGWAIYNSSSRFGFKSWRDGMFVVAKGLKENYINKGLTDPYLMNRVYAASPAWGTKVTYFMNDLEKFAQNYPQIQAIRYDIILSQIKIAAVSGILDNEN